MTKLSQESQFEIGRFYFCCETHYFTPFYPSTVPRARLVQDYAEGGARCLDIEVFTRSLYLRQVRQLLDPNPQPWRGIGWYFVQVKYGHLRMGQSIVTSACDFLAVLDCAEIPLWWQSVLVAWGGMPGLVPAVDQSGCDPLVGWAEARGRPTGVDYISHGMEKTSGWAASARAE